MNTFDAARPDETRAPLDRAARLAVAGELVASITHDLRQPLTAIEMNVAAALRVLERADLAQSADLSLAIAALHDALNEQMRMREALEVLQDLAAQREPSFRPLDPCASVREAVHLMTSEASQRHVRLDVVYGAKVPNILADAALMRQALLNLLLEALDAATRCDEGRRSVRVDVQPHATAGVEITVAHYGPGDHVTPDLTSLALARSVVDAHGASLRVSRDDDDRLTLRMQWPVLGLAAQEASVQEA